MILDDINYMILDSVTVTQFGPITIRVTTLKCNKLYLHVLILVSDIRKSHLKLCLFVCCLTAHQHYLGH